MAERKPLYEYGAWILCALIGISILTNTDIILVKWLFGPAKGGDYAVAATVARIALFLPVPLAAAMFPKVADDSGRENSRVFLKALVVTMMIIAPVTLISCLFPHQLLSFVRGASNAEQARTLRYVALAISPLPVTALMVNYEMARRSRWVIYPLLTGATVLILVLSFWHAETWHVILAFGSGGYTAFLMIAPRVWLRVLWKR